MPRSRAEVEKLEERLLSPSSRLRFPLVVVDKASGATLADVDGREYLDFHAMAGVAAIGHNHAALTHAIREQSEKLLCCNIAYAVHEPLLDLAERLLGLAPFQDDDYRVAIGLSGSDASDGAMKLARASTGRWQIISFKGAYHGTTYGALSLSATDLNMVRGFGPGVPGIHHVPYPDSFRMNGSPDEISEWCLQRLRELLEREVPAEEVAAVFVEPIQGDSGILVPPHNFLPRLAELCSEYGILLVADEVQTGLGRTGAWLASHDSRIQPDIVLLGKALGGGVPISAVIARSDLMDSWKAPGHVFGVGGSPLACVAGITTLNVIEEERLIKNAELRGAELMAGLLELKSRHESIGDVRGRGLMLGVDLVTDRSTRERNPLLAKQVLVGSFRRGLFITYLAGNVLRLIPPLVVTKRDVENAISIIDDALTDAAEGRVDPGEVAKIVGW